MSKAMLNHIPAYVVLQVHIDRISVVLKNGQLLSPLIKVRVQAK